MPHSQGQEIGCKLRGLRKSWVDSFNNIASTGGSKEIKCISMSCMFFFAGWKRKPQCGMECQWRWNLKTTWFSGRHLLSSCRISTPRVSQCSCKWFNSFAVIPNYQFWILLNIVWHVKRQSWVESWKFPLSSWLEAIVLTSLPQFWLLVTCQSKSIFRSLT